MNSKKRVILITDGDASAKSAVQRVAAELNGYVVLESASNPTKLSGKELLKLILQADKEPVLVMFDDSGLPEEGLGETALIHIVNSPNVEILGAIAVASQSFSHEWTKIDVAIDREGEITEYGVDKDGIQEMEVGRIRGDTVYSLDRLQIPIIVGVGDIGKMGGKDDVKEGSPITKKAVELILERSGFHESRS